MKVEQIYTGCLAQGAYYIESNGEALIIDPLREVQPYINKAERNGATIKYVLETHFHADFVSGHFDLAKATGAQIVFGPTTANIDGAYIAKDNEVLSLGDIKIKVLHTPGHTMESTCYLLIDEQGKEVALFSGDTLFIGDVGRPDLAQKISDDLTPEFLAGTLYDSLRNKILPLNDDIIVYPAHGAGSACGKNMSKETTDTLGNQKKVNYALDTTLSKDEFIKMLIKDLPKAPSYFPANVMMNIQGYDSIDTVLNRGLQKLNPEAFELLAEETEALILDTRHPEVFIKGFVPNSINIGIDGSFAPWVGTLITDIKQTLLLVIEAGREEEVVTRLSRVGYDNAIGYLEGGIEAWQAAGKEVDAINQTTAEELSKTLSADDFNKIIDARKASEYFSEHIIGAENMPLDYINEAMASINKEQTYYVHCASGYRSVIFNSIMRARGFYNLVDVKGGFKALQASTLFPVSNYVCPSTML